jgi:hypothetical protein
MEDTDLTWRKTSYSSNGGAECVEVADHGHRVLVRDTKDRTGPMLRFTPGAWRRFADQVKRSLTSGPLSRAGRRSARRGGALVFWGSSLRCVVAVSLALIRRVPGYERFPWPLAWRAPGLCCSSVIGVGRYWFCLFGEAGWGSGGKPGTGPLGVPGGSGFPQVFNLCFSSCLFTRVVEP